MQAVILNGARLGDHATDAAHAMVVEELQHLGYTVQPFILRDAKIAYCQGDFECWIKTPGLCKADDDGRVIARAVIQSDLAIFLTPITFGGYSSELKRALDKMICLVSPFFAKIRGEVHHQKRYDRYPRLLGIGTLAQRDPESERIFTTLVSRNALNMHAPAHAAQVMLENDNADTLRANLHAMLATVGGQR